jgi:ribosomal protein L16/L10AE
MYEITGVAEKLAVEALELAAAKLPIKTKIVIRSNSLI